jgi:hypothetical protein
MGVLELISLWHLSHVPYLRQDAKETGAQDMETENDDFCLTTSSATHGENSASHFEPV